MMFLKVIIVLSGAVPKICFTGIADVHVNVLGGGVRVG